MPPSTAIIASPRIAVASAPAKVRAPYDVQIIRESGETLPTYSKADRFYVQGSAGERYTIRVVNPTGNRIEAVVSVDGLDVVDGEAGDLHKRGYVVPPYGETRIEGFRTSTEDVATFRFSSVDGSYAGQKGKARNVGVIAVALFEEQHAPEQQIIVGEKERNYRYDYESDLDASDGGGYRGAAEGKSAPRDRVSTADKAPSRRVRTMDERAPAPSPTTTGSSVGAVRPSAPPPPRPDMRKKQIESDSNYDDYGGDYEEAPVTQNAPKTERPGLGTEFGESRYSAASYTKFVRSNDRPIAIAELRYNDVSGLMALGIPVMPLPDDGEIMTRETADPFPGDSRFSRAP